MKKIALLLSLFSTCSFAQVTDNVITEQVINVTSVVPQLCNVKSGLTHFQFSGTYYNTAINSSSSYEFNCVSGVIINIKVGLGSNPQSTADERRLPFNGEVGDVKHYLSYQLIMDNKILDDAVGVTSSNKKVYVSFKAEKNQPNIVIGKFKDTLPVYVDYY